MSDLKPRFGDIIENGWASEDNPTRRGFFVREGRRTGRMNAGRYFEATDGAGKFWELPIDRDHKVTIAARAHPHPDVSPDHIPDAGKMVSDGEREAVARLDRVQRGEGLLDVYGYTDPDVRLRGDLAAVLALRSTPVRGWESLDDCPSDGRDVLLAWSNGDVERREADGAWWRSQPWRERWPVAWMPNALPNPPPPEKEER